jgi:hypothetical protein
MDRRTTKALTIFVILVLAAIVIALIDGSGGDQGAPTIIAFSVAALWMLYAIIMVAWDRLSNGVRSYYLVRAEDLDASGRAAYYIKPVPSEGVMALAEGMMVDLPWWGRVKWVRYDDEKDTCEIRVEWQPKKEGGGPTMFDLEDDGWTRYYVEEGKKGNRNE